MCRLLLLCGAACAAMRTRIPVTHACLLLLLHILLHAAINEFSYCYICVLILQVRTRLHTQWQEKTLQVARCEEKTRGLTGTQFTFFTGTKVQILTQKDAWPHRATPSGSRAQGTRCSCARCGRGARRGVHSARGRGRGGKCEGRWATEQSFVQVLSLLALLVQKYKY